jgi:outer membrane receptor for ferrienterochelin and colicins
MRPFSADAFATGWGEVNVDIGFKANIGNAAAVLTGINYFNYSNPLTTTKQLHRLNTAGPVSVFQNGVSTERTTNSLAGRYFMKTDGEANYNGKKIPRWN